MRPYNRKDLAYIRESDKQGHHTEIVSRLLATIDDREKKLRAVQDALRILANAKDEEDIAYEQSMREFAAGVR